MRSPFFRADWWATTPGTVKLSAIAMSTSGLRSSRIAVTNSFIRCPCDPPWPPGSTEAGNGGRSRWGSFVLLTGVLHSHHVAPLTINATGLTTRDEGVPANPHAGHAALTGAQKGDLGAERVLVAVVLRHAIP